MLCIWDRGRGGGLLGRGVGALLLKMMMQRRD
jgi:hypothetical protein